MQMVDLKENTIVVYNARRELLASADVAIGHFKKRTTCMYMYIIHGNRNLRRDRSVLKCISIFMLRIYTYALENRRLVERDPAIYCRHCHRCSVSDVF